MQRAFTRKYNTIKKVLTDTVEVSFCGQVLKLYNAIWDTGASASSINIKHSEKLGLMPVSYANINTANGSCIVPVFYINIKFNENFIMNGLAVTGCDLGEVDMLLGMDIISKWQFTISNNNSGTTISFIHPSDCTTDYVKEINEKLARRLRKIGRNGLCPCGSGKKVKDCCGPKYGV